MSTNIPARPPHGLLRGPPNYTTFPYQPQTVHSLNVTRTDHEEIGIGPLAVTITRRCYGGRLSPVVEVEFVGALSGIKTTAILKLFDHRHPPTFRDGVNGYRPHRPEDQLAWEDFVRKGKLHPFIDELTLAKKQALGLYSPSYELNEEEPQSDEILGRYEAALYCTASEFFESETRAYQDLKELQGKCIPKLYAHVFVNIPTIDPALTGRPEFKVLGILIEPIRGFILDRLPDLPVADAPPRDLWESIVQDAVHSANEINRRGVVMLDCRAGNVLVEENTHRVVIHDFAQCHFREDLEVGYAEEDTVAVEHVEHVTDEKAPGENMQETGDTVLPVSHEECVASHENPLAIGMPLTVKILNKTGIDLRYKIRYFRLDTEVDNSKFIWPRSQ